jgi:hypothetical protein
MMSTSLSDRDPSSPARLVPGDLVTTRLFFFLTTVLAAAALPQLLERGKFSGQVYASYSAQWLALLSLAVLIALANLTLLILSWSSATRISTPWFTKVRQLANRNAFLWVIAFILLWIAYVLLILNRYQKHFTDFLPQVWLFFLVCGMGALFLQMVWKGTTFFWAFLFTSVLYGAGIKAIGYLPEISSIPFSLSWSEGSRFYYASLPFAHWLYGFDIPLSSLHPSRYLLQTIAFLAPQAGILFHRFWQVALWLSMSFLTGLVLVRRVQRASILVTLALALWCALFFLQGPVYYHLLVVAMLVIWGFDRHRFWKSLIFVILASLWAGISRVNWFPVPAMLAATLYMLEKPFCEGKSVTTRRGWLPMAASYFWPPIIWGLAGGLAALLSQAVYVLVSGQKEIAHFGTSFSSPLLWYRLFPSPTYPMGVLLAVLLVTLPLIILIAGNWLKNRVYWHPLRILGIFTVLIIFFVGGLVVSAKIGGGSNLHNMDAFLVLLLVTGTIIGAGSFASETGDSPLIWRPWPLLLVIVLVPVIYNINVGDPFAERDYAQADYDLNKLNGYVQQYAPKGEVLFITQRQLEVFGQIPGVRMVPDYELITLTEMSISNNQEYLNRFNSDLKNHRFALIVTSLDRQVLKDPAQASFAEENNAWLEHVVLPLDQYYREEMVFDTQGILLLVPKD